MNKSNKKLFLNPATLKRNFDRSIFEGINCSYDSFHNHKKVAAELRKKNPYTITVIIENLKYEYWNKKEYVEKTKIPIETKYRELLYGLFFKEYGHTEGNEIYRKWLDKYEFSWKEKQKYETIDDCVVSRELEPKYRQKILNRFKNHDKLFKERIKIERERYYNLPEPLNRIDWRTPYDNLFIWEGDGKKVAARGGSGSSGRREINSVFTLGLLEINKIKPVPSHLFLYSENNELLFIKKFRSFCIPDYDIGSNYYLNYEEIEKIKKGGIFLTWRGLDKVESIEFSST